MSRHGNISVFVPHIGCPHRCSFCNQYGITGQNAAPTLDTVKQAVETAAAAPGYLPQQTELAFFGGSFTAIEPEYMKQLLEIGAAYVHTGLGSGIRISTRPDAVDDGVLALLREHAVTAVELGCQSMEDRVLRLNDRGHTAEQVRRAAERVRAFGFSLGLQMMTGLYGDTDEGAMRTAQEIIRMSADTVRIYPTLVLEGTRLCALYRSGEYRPQTLDGAVRLAARLVMRFEENGVRVIRTGLHTVDTDRLVAGPWHPAFGELCAGEVLLEQVIGQIREKGLAPGSLHITVPRGFRSKMVGQNKRNIEFLSRMGYNAVISEEQSAKGVTVR